MLPRFVSNQFHWCFQSFIYCSTLAILTHVYWIIYLFWNIHFKKWNISKYLLFSFIIFFDLEEIIFENFNISENNIISVELAKVLKVHFQFFSNNISNFWTLLLMGFPTLGQWCLRLVMCFLRLSLIDIIFLNFKYFPKAFPLNVHLG